MPLSSSTRTCSRLTLTLTLIFLIALSAPLSRSSTETAYQVIEDYDFPVGLLPKGVAGYELNSTTSAFAVYLNGTCTFSISSYELKYKSTITGYIATDKITSLSGVYVKVWFFWLKIEEIIRDGDELEFSVGIASADFPVTNFDESPTCGCGFDCDSFDDDQNGDNDNMVIMRKIMRLKGGASKLVSSSS